MDYFIVVSSSIWCDDSHNGQIVWDLCLEFVNSYRHCVMTWHECHDSKASDSSSYWCELSPRGMQSITVWYIFCVITMSNCWVLVQVPLPKGFHQFAIFLLFRCSIRCQRELGVRLRGPRPAKPRPAAAPAAAAATSAVPAPTAAGSHPAETSGTTWRSPGPAPGPWEDPSPGD